MSDAKGTTAENVDKTTVTPGPVQTDSAPRRRRRGLLDEMPGSLLDKVHPLQSQSSTATKDTNPNKDSEALFGGQHSTTVQDASAPSKPELEVDNKAQADVPPSSETEQLTSKTSTGANVAADGKPLVESLNQHAHSGIAAVTLQETPVKPEAIVGDKHPEPGASATLPTPSIQPTPMDVKPFPPPKSVSPAVKLGSDSTAPKASSGPVRVLSPERLSENKMKKKDPESDKIDRMLQLIRTDLPSSKGPGQRMFFPKELPDRLTLARKYLLQFRHKIPERSIALTGVLNLLDQLEAVHGGPFDSPIAWDSEDQARLREMIGEFKETPQESFSFGMDEDLQHRLRIAAEYMGVKIRQLVATGIELILKNMEDIVGRPFNEAPRIKRASSANSTATSTVAPPA